MNTYKYKLAKEGDRLVLNTNFELDQYDDSESLMTIHGVDYAYAKGRYTAEIFNGVMFDINEVMVSVSEWADHKIKEIESTPKHAKSIELPF